MTALRGICLDGMNPFGRPSVRSLKLLKVNGARMVAFDKPMWYSYYRELEAASLELAVVYTGQSFDPDSAIGRDIPEMCKFYASVINPEIHVLGNEFNVQHAATWPPRGGGEDGDHAFVEFWNLAAPAIKAVRPNARLYTSWYSDPDPIGHIREVHARLSPQPDGVDYHPYEETYEDAERVLTQIRSEFGGSIISLEWNDSNFLGIARFKKTLERTTDHDCFFCYDDRMVPDHGVIDSLGRRKPQWHALREALSG